MKFKDFNLSENPNDEAVYASLKNSAIVGDRVSLKTFDEIITLATSTPSLEIGWLVPKKYTVIVINCQTTVKVIQSLKIPAFVIFNKNIDSYYVVVELDFKNTENNLLLNGVNCYTLTSNSKKNLILPLPFKSSINTSAIAANIHFIHYNKIGKAPNWLTPLFANSRKTKTHVVNLPLLDPSSELKKIAFMYRHSSLRTKEQISLIEFINTNFTVTPLDTSSLEEVLESGRFLSADFFDPLSGKFYHDLMGDFLIKEYLIKLEKETNNLYFWSEEDLIYKSDDKYLLHLMTKIAPELRTTQKEEVVDYIKQILYPKSVVFNSDPLCIVFNNGFLDLRTKTFEPMTPKRLETIKIKANYLEHLPKSHATADEFFDNLTIGNKLIYQLLLEMLGYTMLKTNGLQKAFILLGGGRNGKSTLLNLIRAMLGLENVGTLSFKDLNNNFRSSGIVGKLASLAGDISSQAISDSDMIKSMIGGDLVKMEKKHKDSFDTEIFATFIYSANRLPRTPDTTSGFYRRFAIIPLKANLSKISKVQGQLFTEKLFSQESLDYVATKATHAIYDVYHTTEDFVMVPEVEDMLEKYKIENSSILSWFNDSYQNNKAKILTKNIQTLYDEYTAYCEVNHFNVMRSSRFRSELETDLEISVDITGKLSELEPEDDDVAEIVLPEGTSSIDKRA